MSEPAAAGPPPRPLRAPPPASLAAFLAMAFLVAALAGIFATYAAPAPYARAFALEAAIDAAEQAGGGDLERLAAHLAQTEGIACPSARPAALRGCVRESAGREAAALAVRLRWLIGLASLTGAVFAIALFGARRR